MPRVGVMPLFGPVTFETTPDGEAVCKGCGALVRNQRAHRAFHEALALTARDADDARSTANSAMGRARRGGW